MFEIFLHFISITKFKQGTQLIMKNKKQLLHNSQNRIVT